MKTRTIRWRTCIGLGSLLGIVAAGADLIPRPQASESAQASPPAGSKLIEPCGAGGKPICCTDATDKGRLLTLASATPQAASAWLSGTKPNLPLILAQNPFRTGLVGRLKNVQMAMSLIKRLQEIESLSPRRK